MRDQFTQISLVFLVTGIVLLFSSPANAQSTARPKSSSVSTSARMEREAKAAFKRLLDLQARLKRIPSEDQEKEPHKSFLKANENDIVYSDPSAEYYVRSDRFWNLEKKYRSTSIADDIAWTAAQNPIPGECEGDVSCYLYSVIETSGEYLKRYPRGKKASTTINDIGESLQMMIEDLKTKAGFTWPTEPGDKAEMTKNLVELKGIVGRTSDPNRVQVIAQIEKISAELK